MYSASKLVVDSLMTSFPYVERPLLSVWIEVVAVLIITHKWIRHDLHPHESVRVGDVWGVAYVRACERVSGRVVLCEFSDPNGY